jgi:hypothetical protein
VTTDDVQRYMLRCSALPAADGIPAAGGETRVPPSLLARADEVIE